MKQVTLGFVPTRRNIFSAPAAVEYADLTRKRLEQLGVRFVDVTGINPEGLFYDEADRAAKNCDCVKVKIMVGENRSGGGEPPLP